jgi:hypothetical protein
MDAVDECSICGEKRPVINMEHTGRELFESKLIALR